MIDGSHMNNSKVAVLIDAENISPKYAQLMLSEAGNFGNVICKRIYGDWSCSSLSSWKMPIMEHSINAIQQFHSASGKNASDSALIIDAMDLLHEGKYQSICIVSSDSDFTKLALRLRESEVYVVGMGEQKTLASFRSACDKFLYLDVLFKENSEGKEKPNPEEKEGKQQTIEISDASQSGLNLNTVITTINEIIDTVSDEDGWAGLATVGSVLSNKITDFDVRNFGCKKLSQFIKEQEIYEVKADCAESNPNNKVVYVKRKKTGNP